MSYINPESMAFRDGRDVDAFHRLRVSSPYTLFSNFNEFGSNARDWVGVNTGTGTSTFLPNEASMEMTTGGTAAGAEVIRQTRLCWRGNPGRSMFITMSQSFGAPVMNVRRRVGWFDGGNGVFLEQTSAGVRLVKRTNISGAPSDSILAEQANWNIDPMDGTGPSGETINWEHRQTMFLDVQYTGTGRGRVGFMIGGKLWYVHDFASGNVPLLTQIRTPNLPLRAEITNTGVAGSVATMKLSGSSVMSEGGSDAFARGILNSASRGTNTVGVTTRRPILSLRPKATFNGLPNIGWIVPYGYSTIASGNDAYIELVVGGALTGASWTSVGADSLVEFDIAATAITGGASVIKEFVASGQGNSASTHVSDIIDNFPTSVDTLVGNQLIYSIVATSMSGTSTLSASANWREIYAITTAIAGGLLLLSTLTSGWNSVLCWCGSA